MASISDDDGDALKLILEQIGMSDLFIAFKDNLITLNEVKDMSDGDFDRLGISAIGNRIKIKRAVADFIKGNQVTPPSVAKYIEFQQRRKDRNVTVKNQYSLKITRRAVDDLSSGEELPEISINHRLASETTPKEKLVHAVAEDRVPQTEHQEDDIDTGTPTVTFKRRPKFVKRQRPNMESDVYSSYVGLVSNTVTISSSDDDLEEMYLPAHGPANTVDGSSSSKEAVKLYDILNGLRITCDGLPSKFNVTRSNPLEGARRAVHREDFNPAKPISVRFADDLGQSEGAVDSGGPKRELFRLILKEIKDSVAFIGDESAKLFSLNSEDLRYGLYRDIGVLLAMAIVHGGQWPGFFHPETYTSFALGPSYTNVTVDDIVDLELRHMIVKLQQANTRDEIEEVLEANYTLFNISGCFRPFQDFSEQLRDQLVRDMLHFLVIGRSLPAVSQFLEGLEALGLRQAILQYPEQLREVFCQKPHPLTAEMVEAVFVKVQYSEVGSNRRMNEERTMTYWCVGDIEDGNANVTLKELLAFATGSDQIPFLGFGTDPSIEFLNEGTYPKANTCAMVLRLPHHKDFKSFKDCMEFGIRNSPGFGMA